MAPLILTRLRTADNLPTLSTVAMEVLQLCRNEDVSLRKIGELVQEDAALAAKILKTVNSPLFGMQRRIASLPQAVALLGAVTVKQLALSFSLVDVVESGKSEDFDFADYWRRSLTSSAAARLLGEAVDPQLAEEAFIGALLSDLGMVAAWQCARDLYKPVVRRFAKARSVLSDIESEELGVTHADIGRELLTMWNLPEVLCEVVGAHHGDGLERLEGRSRSIAKIVHCATLIAEVFCKDVSPTQLNEIKRRCIEALGIGEAELEEVLLDLNRHVQASALLLAVQVGELFDYVRLQEDASKELARMKEQPEPIPSGTS